MKAASTDRVRVLYVEDAIDEALVVRTFFAERPGYQVTYSQDGDRALELLRSREWDILVTDLNLPGADGFDVIRAARRGDRKLPILAVTGYAQEHYWDQAFRSGANQVMVKPLEREEFMGRVESMVQAGGTVQQPEHPTMLVVEGLVGDGVMGCGGTMLLAQGEGLRVVLMPITLDPTLVTPVELEGAKLCSQMIGAKLQLAESLLGDTAGLTSLVERVVQQVRPTVMYVPAIDDSHPTRMEASRIAITAAPEVELIYGYQTATTGMDFVPTHFVDIGSQIIVKSEAVGVFQSLGTGRSDLRPKLVQAYATYWGRFQQFEEVEAFEVIRGSHA